MRKKLYILCVCLLMSFMGESQNFYFFCINIGENSDGDYIVDQIETLLPKKLSENDAFMVYIRGGANNNGKIYDSYVIENMDEWNDKKSKIKGLKQYSVLPKPEIDNLMRLFQNKYEIVNNNFTAKYAIYVYWFADKYYYENYGSDILLELYNACMGKNLNSSNTWQLCHLYPDRRGGISNMTFGELIKNPFIRYDNISVINN